MSILVTGSAGFIGFHICKKLIQENHNVIGIDNLNGYYDINLKKSRLSFLEEISSKDRKFSFEQIDIENKNELISIFNNYKPKKVINLAAQAGVRYSIENPDAYIQSNIIGFYNILEACRFHNIEHLIYASSSSVYGGNTNFPFSESHGVDHPVSLYAATKKSNEIMAHSYSSLYGIPATGLRFFTVYGPWGRPDMALFLFTKSIKEGKPIKIFNKGKMVRDFTYIDDITESIYRLLKKDPSPDENFDKYFPNPATSWVSHRIFNIGNSNPVPLMDYICAIEEALGIESQKIFLPMQKGDVEVTAANTSKLEEWIKYKPNTSVKEGVSKFVKWYNNFYV